MCRGFGLPIWLTLAAACTPPAFTPTGARTPASSSSAAPEVSKSHLFISPGTGVLSSRPDLVRRMRGDVFAYFRFINDAFTRESCSLIPRTEPREPLVNLHGDAHLEQYAVAVDGEGLADFDAATLGQPSIDFLRFGTSLVLAAPDAGGAAEAIAAFAEGYREGLQEPEGAPQQTAAAARMRASFAPTSQIWLDRAEQLMQPMTPLEREHMERARARYISAMLAQNPDLSASFFQLKKGGSLRMGLGSAREAKFLQRVEGPTSAPDDDVILETKQVAEAVECSCVVARSDDAQRVIVGQARLSTSPQRFLGYVEFEQERFYVHAWRVHYRELSLADLNNSAELAEVAHAVGLQLGRGHPRQFENAAELRAELSALIAHRLPTLLRDSERLAQEVRLAWRQFDLASRQRVP